MKKKLTFFVFIAFLFCFACFSSYKYFPFVACKIYEYKNYNKYHLKVNKIKVNDDIVTYAEGGDKDKELLIFIHGFQADKRFWLSYLGPFIEKYHILIPDLPAHGGSSFQPNQKFDISSLSITFDDFIQAIGVKKFSLVGTSLGGGIAMKYCATFPERVQNLILINPIGIRPENEKDYVELISRNEGIFFPNTLKELDNLYCYLMGKPFPAAFPIKRYFLEYLIQKRPVFKKVFEDLITSDGIQKELANITVPTLILMGDNDRVSSLEDFKIYSSNIPNCRAILISNGYHILNGKPFEDALFEMQDFLNVR